jgi:hypothetical protein
MRLRRSKHARLHTGHWVVTVAAAQRWVQVRVTGRRWWLW